MTRHATARIRLAAAGALVMVMVMVMVNAGAPTLVAQAAGSARSAPQLLVGVPGTSTVYVVSVRSAFESNNPAACGYQACFVFQRTSDNGAHFTSRRLPRITFSNGSLLGNLEDLHFATERDGYALLRYGSTLALDVTRDGALTWHKVVIAPGASVVGLKAASGELYVIIARCPPNSGCTDYRLAHASLSAQHWTITNLPAQPQGMGVGLGAFGRNVWLTEQGRTTVWLYTSHDAGKTFTRSSAPDLGSVYACGLTAMSATAIWAECPTGMMVAFFFSADGGVHWRHFSKFGFSGTGGGYFDPVSSTLAYLDYGEYFSGSHDDLFRVTNNARTTTGVGRLACSDVSGLVFTDTLHGLAACDTTGTNAGAFLLRSSDGGVTWSKVNLG